MKPKDLHKLVTFAMPYGKYKGRVNADLPRRYRNWFAREGFTNGELGRLSVWLDRDKRTYLSAVQRVSLN